MSTQELVPEHLQEAFICGAFDKELLRFQPTLTKAGRISPYYCDMRTIFSIDPLLLRSDGMSAEAQRKVGQFAISAFCHIFTYSRPGFDHILSKAQAANQLVAPAAVNSMKSFLWERLANPNKKHGSNNQIEGSFEPGQRVILADDVLSSAESALELKGIAEENGLVVTSLAVLLDREEGGRTRLMESGVVSHSAIRLSRAIKYLADSYRIGPKEIDAVDRYHTELRESGVDSTYSFGR